MTRGYNEIIDWMQLIAKANTRLTHYWGMVAKANELADIQGTRIDPVHVSNDSNSNGTENKLIKYLDIKEQLNKIDTKHTYHLDIVGLNNLTKVDKVIFHGFLNKSNPEEAKKLEQLYQQADLFFVPSRFESFGYVFLEASGNGLPVITSAVGGIPESIIHNETGLVLPYEAKGLDYAQKIIDLVKNPQLYSQFSINGINRIQDNYSWQLWGDTVYSILENFMR